MVEVDIRGQENQKHVEIKVIGLVQGVFFRYEAKMLAEKLGLTGFVRNEPDASVVIIAEGEEERLQKLINWAKVGTKWSKIESIKVEWRNAARKFNGFEIL